MKTKSFFIGLFLSLILCLTIVNSGAADTTVSGIINNDTTWTLANSPYIVTGNLLVSEGITLTIEPGIEVWFESAMTLQLRGTLIARGTSDNMITFTSNQPSPAPGDWGNIYFKDTSPNATFDADGNYTGGSILDYCIVEYAGGLGVDYGSIMMDGACPFINHCTIRHNSVSGITSNGDMSAELRITNNTISNNTTLGWGGGIYNNGGTAIISDNIISDNTAAMGGGIYNNGGTVIISDNIISDNTADSYGGGIITVNGTHTISNNIIINNISVRYSGGGIYADPGTSTYNPDFATVITNNTISNNTARNEGGGIYNKSGTVIISDNVISDNTVYNKGGGIYGYQSNSTVINNIVSDNIAENGGGIYNNGGTVIISDNVISDNTADSYGGGIYNDHGTTTISNNSIITNTASNSSAVYFLETYISGINYNTITGNISTGIDLTYAFYFNSHPYSNSPPPFDHNNIYDNSATYQLYNANSADSNDMNAENNWWGTKDESEIQAKIYDWFDDGTKGFVDYSPFLTSLDTTAPISPPSNLTVINTDIESITIHWDANQESDIAGYKVYWDTDDKLPYENVVDVGSDTTYTVTGVDPANYYIGVTAYDNDYNATNDDPDTIVNENQTNGNESWYCTAAPPSPISGYLVTDDLWIRAVINTEEKGPIEAVWKKGGEDTTSRGDRVIYGHFYADPNDVTWGSQNNPDLFVKIWFDVSGRVDVNYFHVSVPNIEVYSDYLYDGTYDQQGTTTMTRRYIRQYYENGQSYSDENYEDGNPPAGYLPTGNPSGYLTINDLRIGSIINTVEKGPIDALWRLGGQDTTARGDQVVWGHFYASPTDVTWGSQNNPDLFVKIWFDVSGRTDVNFFHVSVPDIEVYSDLPDDCAYDQKGTTIMDNRYIRHEYWR